MLWWQRRLAISFASWSGNMRWRSFLLTQQRRSERFELLAVVQLEFAELDL